MGVLSILLAVLRTAALIILILVIMLIILAALLLFSPIGYRLRGSFADEQPDGTARFSAFFLISMLEAPETISSFISSVMFKISNTPILP